MSSLLSPSLPSQENCLLSFDCHRKLPPLVSCPIPHCWSLETLAGAAIAAPGSTRLPGIVANSRELLSRPCIFVLLPPKVAALQTSADSCDLHLLFPSTITSFDMSWFFVVVVYYRPVHREQTLAIEASRRPRIRAQRPLPPPPRHCQS
jgi:hypothetical protein